ncbi:MAG: adenylate/guanylate cyclase domain-containing protein [Candidatus Eisenbacteria bacterium]|nr:adenylate/guanylate cyclase domain-containing protein [Candidatus Eisenbacteria bacterium]
MERFYKTPPLTDRPPRTLVACAGSAAGERYVFHDRIEIGRHRQGDDPPPGVLRLRDPTVSSRHCIISQSLDGRCFARDMSLNGTWVDGRRLIPNLEVEVSPGQVIHVADGHEFVIEDSPDGDAAKGHRAARSATVAVSVPVMASVLVGDIRDYTRLVQKAASTQLQESVRRVFERLAAETERHRGTVKEYQGDAIVAFWEDPGSTAAGRTRGAPAAQGIPGGRQVASACAAALALDKLALSLAADPSVWALPGFPLHMDWAVATGPVTIGSIGEAGRAVLSIVGEPIVLAFRLEKLACAETGRILACPRTENAASEAFEFRDLGEKHAAGFSKPERVFELTGPRSG